MLLFATAPWSYPRRMRMHQIYIRGHRLQHLLGPIKYHPRHLLSHIRRPPRNLLPGRFLKSRPNPPPKLFPKSLLILPLKSYLSLLHNCLNHLHNYSRVLRSHLKFPHDYLKLLRSHLKSLHSSHRKRHLKHRRRHYRRVLLSHPLLTLCLIKARSLASARRRRTA